MKFRRKSARPGATDESSESPEAPVPAAGPYDAEEAPAALEDVERADLGSLVVPATTGLELRLQVDEASGTVQSVLVTGPEGAMELRAFAAPRNGDLWSEIRPQLAADVTRRGGTTDEREGRWGTELLCQLTVPLEDGQTGVQPSRIIGINGARWLLRATLLGRPAVDFAAEGPWIELLTSTVVNRGQGAMPVGEALPLKLPAQARRLG